ncbi:ADP-ribosylglycohydrolase family protein [Limnoglobus roseus]|nr:ADP-ribosylglycohydrolase family protein [Limnoglobus roseus]
MARVQLALDGLSVGDALGSQFFLPKNHLLLQQPEPPIPWGRWGYTDDTEMALGIAEVLERHGRIDQDDLAATFARRFAAEMYRGYGPGAVRLLAAVSGGADWRIASRELFNGGSFGNGSAMRIAPVAAYFADDVNRVVEEARLSVEITHAHAEGIAGGIAVAVAGAFAWQHRGQKESVTLRAELFETVLRHTPEGDTRIGIAHASTVDPAESVATAVSLLGNGHRVTCQDTVPFCLWVIGRHLADYPAAIWTTIRGFGDIDTNAAIVGGVVALACGADGIPQDWLDAREDLQYDS